MIPAINKFLLQSADYKGQRIGMITNDAAQTASGQKSRKALLDEGFNITRLFSPEHGISRTAADGEAQADATDQLTGLPIVSVYGEKLKPSFTDLKDIDLLLFDIPDVGCRFYTYLWTMTFMMEAAAENNIPLMILDRPNPTGNDLNQAEGPLLDEAHCASFIGRWKIPVRHCCTLGELAQYFKAKKIPGCRLQVMVVEDDDRSQQLMEEKDFVPTSPAIQNIQTAILYPGTGLLEGINVNEGRGTTHPFTQFGALWINAGELQKAFAQLQLPGISSSARTYIPEAGEYAGSSCDGLQLTVTDPHALRPVATGIAIIQLLMKLYPAFVRERAYPTAANPTGAGHLDKLLGIPNAFDQLRSGLQIDTDVSEWWKGELKVEG